MKPKGKWFVEEVPWHTEHYDAYVVRTEDKDESSFHLFCEVEADDLADLLNSLDTDEEADSDSLS